jgi:hypothetical protein
MLAETIGPWVILLAYAVVTWLWVTPRRVSSPQFFDGRANAAPAPLPT